jgi:hypothetical protein
MNGLASDVAITTVELAAAGDEVAFARIGLDGRHGDRARRHGLGGG